jgi:hypothetical protein
MHKKKGWQIRFPLGYLVEVGTEPAPTPKPLGGEVGAFTFALCPFTSGAFALDPFASGQAEAFIGSNRSPRTL